MGHTIVRANAREDKEQIPVTEDTFAICKSLEHLTKAIELLTKTMRVPNGR